MTSVLQRDDYTCRCCGFRSERFQRVIPSIPEQKTDDAFITVCPICDSCFNLDQAGMTGEGLLIWLPEMTQADLNAIVRAAFVARARGGELATLADRALEAFKMRRTEVKKRLGSDDPMLLGTAFLENLAAKDYAAREAKLEGIRFLHAERSVVRMREGEVDLFPQIVAYWASEQGPFGAYPAEKWMALFEAASDAA